MINQQYIPRIISLQDKLQKQSQFLFGPRQTGKTSYIRHELSDMVVLSWNLLDGRLRMKAMADPGLLREEIQARGITEGVVVIDEIQKVPALLEEVQILIEESNITFLLTGSSARALRAGGVNPLGGRAGKNAMFPFVYPEIRHTDYTLDRIFSSGLLPPAFCHDSPDMLLDAYVNLYLNEEIQSEGAVRKLPEFVRFLEIAALSNTELINYSNIASDVGITRQAVTGWYQILIDTLIGFELPAYRKTKKRKAIETAKFYFFDIGVMRTLLDIDAPKENQTEYGKFFENYIAMELRAYLDYSQKRETLCFWRSTANQEVDFIIGDSIAIETKTTKAVDSHDCKGLKAFMEEKICDTYIIVCREERPRKLENGILVMPWKYFLEELWEDRLLR